MSNNLKNVISNILYDKLREKPRTNLGRNHPLVQSARGSGLFSSNTTQSTCSQVIEGNVKTIYYNPNKFVTTYNPTISEFTSFRTDYYYSYDNVVYIFYQYAIFNKSETECTFTIYDINGNIISSTTNTGTCYYTGPNCPY